MQSKTTLQTAEERIDKQLNDIEKCQLDDEGQSAKLLSYHSMTDVCLFMEEERLADSLYDSIFCSIANDIKKWPIFLAFVNDDKEIKTIIE